MALFRLGQTVITQGVLALGINLTPYLIEHINGRWGNVCQDDWQANDAAVKNDERIISSYEVSEDTKIWIITEADRSATTVLLPDEY